MPKNQRLSQRPSQAVVFMALSVVHCCQMHGTNFVGSAIGAVSQTALGTGRMELELFNQWDADHCGVVFAESWQSAVAEMQLEKIGETTDAYFRLHTNLRVSGTVHSSAGHDSPNPTADRLSVTLTISYEFPAESYSLRDSFVGVAQRLTVGAREHYDGTDTHHEDPVFAQVSGEGLQSQPSFEPNPQSFNQQSYIGFASNLAQNSISMRTLESGFLVEHIGDLSFTGFSGVGRVSFNPTPDGYEFSADLGTTFNQPMSLNIEQFSFSTDLFGMLRTHYELCPDGGSNLALFLIGSSTLTVLGRVAGCRNGGSTSAHDRRNAR